MRLAAYAGASTVAAAGVVLWAFNQRANFYSACVYLAQSNLCLMILTNLILLITCTLFYALQRLCYGPLRPIEMEQLYEKAWFAVTETCLAMTIFREEVGPWLMVMFVALLAGRVWGWIGEGRVEILEQQPPANPRLFHARLSISLALSLLYDASIMSFAINTVIQQARPNMMVMFLFEFAILTTCSFSTCLRYFISIIEAKIIKQQTEERLAERRREVREARAEAIRLRNAEASTNGEGDAQAPNDLPAEEDIDEIDIEVSGWEAKGQWVLTLDLVTDLFKLAIYSIFFFILMTFYGLPIHIMRDLFLTARSFVKRLTAFLRYRRATQDMNRRYPDATVEDIAREDTCIICREDMRPWSETNPPRDGAAGAAPPRGGSPANERSRPKKLPCGHILHLGCLKSWLERQQVCPTCRRPVVDNPRSPENRPNNPGNAQGAAAPQQPHQPGAAPPPAAPRANGGMRMLNFGPIRVGFGQANMQEIAQQLGGQQQNPGARMYGFEFGFPRNQQQQQPQPQAATSSPAASSIQVQAQLQLIEQQIMQQIRSLQVTQQELHLVQLLQAELTRLRNLQNGNQNPASVPPNANNIPHMPNFSSLPLGGLNLSAQPVVQRHAALPGTSSIPSGSPDLPPGVTIPEGWSLLPLQRLDASGVNTPAINASRHSSNHASSTNIDAVSTAATAGSNIYNISNEADSSNAPPQQGPSPSPSNGPITQPEGSSTQQESNPPLNLGSSQSQPSDIPPNPPQSTETPPPTTSTQSTIATPAAIQAGTSSSSTPIPATTSTSTPIPAATSTSETTPLPQNENENEDENRNEHENENRNENEGNDAGDEERRQAKGKARAATVEYSTDVEDQE